jgi:mannose-1-phosphate guanylyltransferase
VVVAAGYGIEEMQRFFDTSELPYEVILSVETEALGTGGAIALARKHLTGSGPILVLNGDLVSSVDVAALAEHHSSTGAAATLSLWPVEDPSRFGVCELNDSGMIRRFQEKPERGTEFSNLINAGCYLLEREVLDSLTLTRHSMEREVFPSIAESGRMAGLEFGGFFVDAGTPPSFLEAAQVCIDNGRFSTGVIIADSWFADAALDAGQVSGSVIGSRVKIGKDANLLNCVVLDGAIIGESVHLDRCLIGEGAIISDGCRLNDKVVGHGEII